MLNRFLDNFTAEPSWKSDLTGAQKLMLIKSATVWAQIPPDKMLGLISKKHAKSPSRQKAKYMGESFQD